MALFGALIVSFLSARTSARVPKQVENGLDLALFNLKFLITPIPTLLFLPREHINTRHSTQGLRQGSRPVIAARTPKMTAQINMVSQYWCQRPLINLQIPSAKVSVFPCRRAQALSAARPHVN